MKKSKMLMCSVATVIVLLSSIAYGQNNDNTLASRGLVGRWEFSSGDYIYYFGSDAYIEFFPDGRVYEHAGEEFGDLTIVDNERFSVRGESQNITYILNSRK